MSVFDTEALLPGPETAMDIFVPATLKLSRRDNPNLLPPPPLPFNPYVKMLLYCQSSGNMNSASMAEYAITTLVSVLLSECHSHIFNFEPKFGVQG